MTQATLPVPLPSRTAGCHAATLVVEIPHAQPYRLATRRAVRVTCLAGTAWLTRDGEHADLILASGDATCVSPRDDAVITGMPACRIGIALD